MKKKDLNIEKYFVDCKLHTISEDKRNPNTITYHFKNIKRRKELNETQITINVKTPYLEDMFKIGECYIIEITDFGQNGLGYYNRYKDIQNIYSFCKSESKEYICEQISKTDSLITYILSNPEAKVYIQWLDEKKWGIIFQKGQKYKLNLSNFIYVGTDSKHMFQKNYIKSKFIDFICVDEF